MSSTENLTKSKTRLRTQILTSKCVFFSNPLVCLIFIAGIGLLIYSNTFHVPFQFDDKSYIFDNPVIKNIQYFFNPSLAKKYDTSYYTHAFYFDSFKNRFIGNLTFAINYKINGNNTTGYHAINISIHIINAILVYFLLSISFKTPILKMSSFGENANLIALSASLLFISHPIQTQAVTYITQRFASMATLFYLVTLITYIKCRISRTYVQRFLLFTLSFISAICAMKSKEIAFTLPLVMTLYEFTFFKEKLSNRLLYLMPFLLTMLIIPLSLVDIDKPAGHLLEAVERATRAESTMSRWTYLFTELRVSVTYLRLLLLPINQNLDYDYPIYSSFLNPDVYLSFFLLVSVFVIAAYCFADSRNRRHELRVIAFGIFWFFITFSVESSFIPTQDVIFEHRVYLPSIGFFISIAIALFSASKKLAIKWPIAEKILLPMLILLLTLFSAATYARNGTWRNELTLWEDVTEKSPNKARGFNELGRVYYQKGNLDKAEELYERALKIDPGYQDAHNNLGLVYMKDLNLMDQAVGHFEAILRTNSQHVEAHFNLGLIYLERGLLISARREFETVLQINPFFDQAATFIIYLSSIDQTSRLSQ